MSEAKIEIRVGAISFSGEGTESWLSEQLDKVIEKIPQLIKVAPIDQEHTKERQTGKPDEQKVLEMSNEQKASGTLAGYLKGKSATTNQTRKFLATALWLTDTTNADSITTQQVVEALTTAKQQDLTNPGDALNKNVSKGFCVKVENKSNQFYVTPEGRADIS